MIPVLVVQVDFVSVRFPPLSLDLGSGWQDDRVVSDLESHIHTLLDSIEPNPKTGRQIVRILGVFSGHDSTDGVNLSRGRPVGEIAVDLDALKKMGDRSPTVMRICQAGQAAAENHPEE